MGKTEDVLRGVKIEREREIKERGENEKKSVKGKLIPLLSLSPLGTSYEERERERLITVPFVITKSPLSHAEKTIFCPKRFFFSEPTKNPVISSVLFATSYVIVRHVGKIDLRFFLFLDVQRINVFRGQNLA